MNVMRSSKKATRFWPIVLLVAAAFAAGSCVPVRFNQKKRLADETMQLDPDSLRAESEAKVLTSREGALGGFNSGGAGGCGCN